MSDRWISLAEAVFRIHGIQAAPVPTPYRPFLVSSSPADVNGTVTLARALPKIDSGADTVWSGSAWRLQSMPSGYAISVRVPGQAAWQVTSVTSEDFETATVLDRNPVSGRTGFRYPTDRLIFVNRLAWLHAVAVHAAGVLWEDRVYLLCGRSEIGKSTLADAWCRHAGAELLNDDRMIVRLHRGEAIAAAAPWHGKNPRVSPSVHRLGGILHLAQGAENRLIPLRGSNAVATLVATSAAPFYLPMAMRLILEAAAGLTHCVPSSRFAFCPGLEAVETCCKWAVESRA